MTVSTATAMSELQLGAASAEQRDFDAAIAHWQRALGMIEQQRASGLAVDPKLIGNLSANIAALCVQKQDLSGAASWIQKAIDAASGHALGALNVGSLLMQAGKLAEAVELFSRVTAADPQCCEAHALLGSCLAQAGQIAGAQASFARAVELRPDWAEAHGKLADLSRQLGDFTRARQHYDRAIALRPGWKEMQYQRATLVTSAVEFNTRESMDSFFGNPGVVEVYLSPERRTFFSSVIGLLVARGIKADHKRIADVGCGTGHLLEAAKRAYPGASLAGFEYSSSALRIARELLPDAQFQEFDIYEGLQGSECFDLVLCTEVLEHLLYPDRALGNLVAMLPAHGTLLLTVPNGRTDTYEGHINFWSPESWKVFVESCATRHGFTLETGLVQCCNFALLSR